VGEVISDTNPDDRIQKGEIIQYDGRWEKFGVCSMKNAKNINFSHLASVSTALGVLGYVLKLRDQKR